MKGRKYMNFDINLKKFFIEENENNYIPATEFLEAVKAALDQMAEYFFKNDLELSEDNLYKKLLDFLNKNNRTLFADEVVIKQIEIIDQNGNKILKNKKVPKGKPAITILKDYKDGIKTYIKQLCQDYKTYSIPHKADAIQFAEAMKKIGCNWNINYLNSSWTAMRRFFENVYNTIGTNGAKKQDYVFIFEQLRNGGGGKGTLIASIKRVFEKYGLASDYDDLPRERFNSNKPAVNNLVIYDDITLKEWQKRNIGVFNNQIDKNFFNFERKGQNGYSVKAKAAHIITTNDNLSDDRNNRRMQYIKYSNDVFCPMGGVVNNRNLKSKEILKKYFECYPYRGNEDKFEERLDYWVEQAFLSCPFGFNYRYNERISFEEAKIPARYSKIIFELQQLKDNLLDSEVCTNDSDVVKYLSNMSFKTFIDRTSFKEKDFDYNKKYFSEFIGDLKTYADHKIDKHGKHFPYYKTDWNKILSYPVQNETDEEKFEDIEDEDKKIQSAFSELVNNAIMDLDDVKPEENKEDEKQISEIDLLRQKIQELMQEKQELEEALQNRQTQKEKLSPEEKQVQEFMKAYGLAAFTDVYSKTPVTELEAGTNYPYLVNGTCTTDNRKGENVIPKMFVFEMDGETKEKQKEIINRILNGAYKDNIASVTGSGNKSYHVLVPHNCNNEIKEDYKYYWEEIAKKIYGDDWEKLDDACASVGRLTRCLNMLREENTNDNIIFTGKQEKIYMNLNAKPIDLTDLVKQKKEKDREEKFKKANFGVSNSNAYFNLNVDEGEKLKNIANKYPINENYRIAREICFSGNVGKGLNPVAIIQSLKKSGFSPEFVKNNIYEPMHRQHHSNTGQSFEYYWNK